MTGEAVSGTRYEVRCDWGPFGFTSERIAREFAAVVDQLACGPHRVWSVDPDGTQTDITDERNEADE